MSHDYDPNAENMHDGYDAYDLDNDQQYEQGGAEVAEHPAEVENEDYQNQTTHNVSLSYEKQDRGEWNDNDDEQEAEQQEWEEQQRMVSSTSESSPTQVDEWIANFKLETKDSIQDVTLKIEDSLREMKERTQSVMKQLQEYLTETDVIKLEYYKCRENQVRESMRLADMEPKILVACDHLLAGAEASARNMSRT